MGKQEVYRFTKKMIGKLQRTANYGEGKTMMAKLRRGVGKNPNDYPEAMSILLQEMPTEFFSNNGEVTKEEWACYIALTLFAFHQQGRNPNTNCMSFDDRSSIGIAMNRLAVKQGDTNAKFRIQNRYKSIATTSDMASLSNHLRHVVSLLKSGGIGFDYGTLASDLYEYQWDSSKSRIIMKWGQDLYRNLQKEDSTSKEEKLND